MIKENYQELVERFYQQNKPFQGNGHIRTEVIDAKDGGKQCQLCGNKHLKYLCKIHNEKGEEWLIGRECHTALDELQEQDFKVAMNELKLCRNCEHWQTTSIWKGKCDKHSWEKSKYSEDCSVPGCPDYVDKYAKYQVAAKGGK